MLTKKVSRLLSLVLRSLSIDTRIISRHSSAMSFKEEKDKFLNMEPEEKRKHYRASEVTTLDEVLTWPEYWQKNKDKIDCVTFESGKDSSSDLASKISIWQGDITALEIDAIVNAANKSLLGGGGVDGAIHRAAGPNLRKECSTLNGCQVGEAKITGGYKLPAKYIIHTVGPQGEKTNKLRQCYLNCLETAKDYGIKSIAFPCISTGIYGYPQRPAAEVALTTVMDYLKDHSEINRVIFCLFLETDKQIYEELLQKHFPQ